MLHNLAVTSASAVLDVLHEQTEKDITVSDLVTDIPDDIEEQERMLQVHYHIHYYNYSRQKCVSDTSICHEIIATIIQVLLLY